MNFIRMRGERTSKKSKANEKKIDRVKLKDLLIYLLVKIHMTMEQTKRKKSDHK